MHLIDLLSILLRCNGFTGIQKAIVDHTSIRSPNNDHDFFWHKFGFRKCFGAFSQDNHWAGHCHLLYKTHFSLHITVRLNGSLLCRIREDDISKWWFLKKFSVTSWGTHLSSLFIFPICFKCWMTTELWMLNSLATSHIVARVSALMIALNWSLSTSDGQPLCSSSPRLSSPLQSFLNHRCTVCLLAVPGPNGLTLQVFYAMYNPLRIWIKTVAQICFLSNIISIV